jgi:hypothetical protein
VHDAPSDSAPELPDAIPPAVDPLDRWLFLAALIISFSLACELVLADPDLWGHTLYGMRAIERGVLCERTDPFSYTAPDARWVNHEWLTELQFGWLWPRFGNLSLWAWRNALVLVIFLCAASEMRRQRASLAASVALLIYGAECLSQCVLFVRPQIATFALFAVTLLALKRHSDGRGRGEIWVLPVLQIAWVNLHGGFLAGLGIIGIPAGMEFLTACWSRKPWKLAQFQISIVFLLSILATFVNPYGPQLYAMLWEHLATEQQVVEWMPLWAARQAPTYYVPLILLGLSLPLSRRWTWNDAAVLAVISFQAISHIRHVALLAIACMILLPGPLSESLPRLFPHFTSLLLRSTGRRLKYVAVGIALGLMILLQILATRELWKRGIPQWEIAVESRSFVPGMPVRAVKFLKALRISGNLLTDYGWAQFILWHAPEFKIAFDGRYRTVYSAELEQEFMSFLRVGKEKPEQTPFLDKYPTEIVLLPLESTPVSYLRQRADWALLYQDDQAIIFVRRIPRFDLLLERKRKDELPIVDTPVWQSFPANTGLPD